MAKQNVTEPGERKIKRALCPSDRSGYLDLCYWMQFPAALVLEMESVGPNRSTHNEPLHVLTLRVIVCDKKDLSHNRRLIKPFRGQPEGSARTLGAAGVEESSLWLYRCADRLACWRSDGQDHSLDRESSRVHV
jgi:hypothetical protein